MRIEYSLGDLAFDVSDLRELEHAVKSFLQEKKLKLNAVRDGQSVFVSYPETENIDAEEDARTVISLCNNRDFKNAGKVVREWLNKVPWSSEAYRLLAQIEIEEGLHDSALRDAKDAVRFNPSNQYALTLVANILSRDKNQIHKGLAYYKRCYDLYQDSVLAINNYAAALLQTMSTKKSVAYSLFRHAIELDPTYLNPYFGLSKEYFEKQDFEGLFSLVREGLVRGIDRPENSAPLRKMMTEILVQAGIQIAGKSHKDAINALRDEIETVGGVKVRLDEDKSSPNPVRVELSKKYGRDYHKVIVNPDKLKYGIEYAVMSELEKLLMAENSKKAGNEAYFANHVNGLRSFSNNISSCVDNKLCSLLPNGDLSGLVAHLYQGLGSQMMNCPLDVIVTDRLFMKFPELRPVQAVVIYQLLQEAAHGVKVGIQQGLPENVIRLNRIMNAVSFIQARSLFGMDLFDDMPVPKDEMRQAFELHCEASRILSNYSAGDEWLLVRSFINKLHCNDFYVVLGGEEPLVEKLKKENSTQVFTDNVRKNPAVGSAILMHMVDAIRILGKMSIQDVKRVAVEIALVGTKGINPSKKSGYSVPGLGNTDMSGCRALAFYYVSWKLAFPEKIELLGLPFSNEYIQAKAIVEKLK